MYTEEYFSNHPDKKDTEAVLYFAVLFNDNEEFFKVGITTRNAFLRLAQETQYNFEVLFEFNLPLYTAYKLEHGILTVFRPLRYTPKHNFGGVTECFTLDESQQIIDYALDLFEQEEV
jgi:hypothetical protein